MGQLEQNVTKKQQSKYGFIVYLRPFLRLLSLKFSNIFCVCSKSMISIRTVTAQLINQTKYTLQLICDNQSFHRHRISLTLAFKLNIFFSSFFLFIYTCIYEHLNVCNVFRGEIDIYDLVGRIMKRESQKQQLLHRWYVWSMNEWKNECNAKSDDSFGKKAKNIDVVIIPRGPINQNQERHQNNEKAKMKLAVSSR